MDSITIYPENDAQKHLLTSLLEEMKVKYEIASEEKLMVDQDFFAKINLSIAQAEQGNTTILSKEHQKEFLGL